MAHSLAEKSDFVQNFIKNATKGRKQWRIHLRKKSHFEQNFIKMRQRAASNDAFLRKLYQNATKGRK